MTKNNFIGKYVTQDQIRKEGENTDYFIEVINDLLSKKGKSSILEKEEVSKEENLKRRLRPEEKERID
jgi:hypothetical protein